MENEQVEFLVNTLPQRVAALRGVVNLLAQRGYANPLFAGQFLRDFEHYRSLLPASGWSNEFTAEFNQRVIDATERLLQTHGVSYWSRTFHSGDVYLIVSVRPLPVANTFGDVWSSLESFIAGGV